MISAAVLASLLKESLIETILSATLSIIFLERVSLPMKDETEVYRPAADLMALKATIDANEYLVKHSEDVLKLAEPVVSMTLTDGMGQAQSSRLGGQPFVPREFEWPQHPVGIYKFLGQINFSEIENRPEALPATGLLVLFFAYDDEGEVFWQDEGDTCALK